MERKDNIQRLRVGVGCLEVVIVKMDISSISASVEYKVFTLKKEEISISNTAKTTKRKDRNA